MTYEEAVKLMINYGEEAIKENAENYSWSITPSGKYPEIVLEYPGYANYRKESNLDRIPGDYRMKYKMPDSNQYRKISHFDICEALFKSSKGKYEAYCKFLEDVCKNGTNIDFSNHETVKNAEKLASVLFWLTVQEDINFPPNKGKEGHVLSFCRYFEAIYAAEYNPKIMEKMEERCKNSRTINLDIGEAPHPRFYMPMVCFEENN